MSSQAVPHPSPANSLPAGIRAAMMMAWREIIRFLRQRNRVIGAVGQPILFWMLFSAGMNQNFQIPGQRFSEYFVPGTLVLILLFTAIFATISIIEDRQEGFLQSVLVAPVPRWSFVLGKVLGGSVLAVGQALIFMILALVFRGSWAPEDLAKLILSIILMSGIAIGLTALGFCLAWRLDSTQGFHAIMNLLLMPMWLLSGAFFPVPPWDSTSWGERALHGVMRLNPVTYAVAGLRQLLNTPSAETHQLWLPNLIVCWLVTFGFAAMMFAIAARVARQPAPGDFQ